MSAVGARQPRRWQQLEVDEIDLREYFKRILTLTRLLGIGVQAVTARRRGRGPDGGQASPGTAAG